MSQIVSERLKSEILAVLPPYDLPGIPPREVNARLPHNARTTIRHALRHLVQAGRVARDGAPERYLYRQAPQA